MQQHNPEMSKSPAFFVENLSYVVMNCWHT